MISSQAYRPSRSIFIGVYTRLAPRAGFNEGLLSLGKHGCNSYCTKRLLTSNAKPGTSTNHGLSSEKGNGVEKSTLSQLWSRFIGPKEMPPRWTPRWYSEMVLICTVFGITGSSTMILVSDMRTFCYQNCTSDTWIDLLFICVARFDQQSVLGWVWKEI